MKSKEELRAIVRSNLLHIIEAMNLALNGKNVHRLKRVLARVGRDQQLPHWYNELRTSGTLPNLDGKTIGSVIEMLLVGVLETGILSKEGVQLRINPARGVDLPDLDLGVKSPSENYCTSEPFFSAYERLYGSDHDLIVLITDYQKAKKKPPLRLQITKHAYLAASEVADRNLCAVALKYRDRLIAEDENWAKKFFRFLAYVNQSDWLAKQILNLFACFEMPDRFDAILTTAEKDFGIKNKERLAKSKLPLGEDDLKALLKLRRIQPVEMAIINAAENWVTDTFHEAARWPNNNEWSRLTKSPLNGRIGVSPALQWRYNFGVLFTGKYTPECEPPADNGD